MTGQATLTEERGGKRWALVGAMVVICVIGVAYLTKRDATELYTQIIQEILDDNIAQNKAKVSFVAVPIAGILANFGLTQEFESYFSFSRTDRELSPSCRATTVDFKARTLHDGYVAVEIDGLNMMKVRACL